MRRIVSIAFLAALSFAAAACGGSSTTATTTGGQALVGTFTLSPGSCSGSSPTGTYFRMITPGGSVSKGPFFSNPDSVCPDKTYTLATPGTDGGFLTGSYQPDPTPTFSRDGSSLAGRIVAPQAFTAINFGISTNPVDPQTRLSVPAPSISVSNGQLSGQIEAWSASWNNQYFNQGSPKPDGSHPGLTSPVSGTYDPTTRAYVLTWASEVVGGPFNGFTGYWHLQGIFEPRSS